MFKKRGTKSALLMSAISLLLCVSMLVGSTFAWFTDEVKSNNNIIKSGNLDVELYWSTNAQDWNKVGADTNVFSPVLWEPGHTEVVYLKVVNEGTLALKYNLGVNIYEEVGSTNVDGKEFKLSDFIQYGVKPVTGAYADRDAARNDVADIATKLNVTYANNDLVLYPQNTEGKASEAVVAMVVYMPETVGNEANYDKNYAVPTIKLGINVFATQMTYESDSFGPDYDENAPYSVWDGTVPTEMPETLVVDGDTQTIHVMDAAAFAYLSTLSAKWAEFYTDGNGTTYTNYANGEGANYYYSGDWTVSLEADIDLDNHPIDPVQIVIGENCGYSAFNGNNHTIRNINTTTGLFADMTRTNYSNLVLVNVKATKGALTGVSGSSITNVTVKNATISGVDYIGGLVGRVFGNVSGCKVIDSSVVATGKEAGGLIGYAETNSNEIVITNNTVKNVSVYANNRAAGLVAQPNVNIKVYNNTVDTVTVGAEDLTKYAAGAVVSNALAPENVYDNTVVNANVLGPIDMVDKPEDLKDAIANAESGDTIILGDGEYSLPSLTNKEGVTIDGGDGAVIKGVNSFGFGTNNTIKNVTFEGSNAVRYGYTHGDVVFENCTFEGKTYGFHVDDAHQGTITFNNCSFSGFNAFAASGTYYFNDCSFQYSGSQGHTNMWGTGYFNNCTWGDKTSVGRGGDYPGTGKVVIDGEDIGYQRDFIGSASTLRAMRNAVDKNGCKKDQSYVLVDDIDLGGTFWYPVKGNFAGTFDGNGHTISNMDLAHEYVGRTENVAFFTSISSTAVIKNVTFDNAKVFGTHYVAVIVGWEGNEVANATIDNCHVINSTVTCDTDASNDNGDKAGAIAGYAVSLNITNCSVKNTTIKAYRDFGGIIGYAHKYVVVTGNTVENVILVVDNDVNYKNYTTDAEHDANPIVGEAVATAKVENNTVK